MPASMDASDGAAVFSSIDSLRLMPCPALIPDSRYLIPSSCRSPMTLLVFLAAAAWTWIVPADLWLLAAHGLDDVIAAGARRSRAATPWTTRNRFVGHRSCRRRPGGG